jgi:diguanylate cyclase (GGDEF)-like protein
MEDLLARYGGEEFAVISSPSTEEGALDRAEKIRCGASLLRLKHANHDLGVITLSIGVAIFPDHAEDAMAIVKAADVALYAAKTSGRNRVVTADPGGTVTVAAQNNVIRALAS